MDSGHLLRPQLYVDVCRRLVSQAAADFVYLDDGRFYRCTAVITIRAGEHNFSTHHHQHLFFKSPMTIYDQNGLHLRSRDLLRSLAFLADRTNSRAHATALRLSSVCRRL